MDFLEIRRKAKERAAARAAAAAHPPVAAAPAPAVAPAMSPEPARPLALEPLPLPAREPISTSPWPDPEEPPAPLTAEAALALALEPLEPAPPAEPALPDPEAERLAAEAAAESARVEAELEAKLRDMPAAPDGRFRTWRPSGGPVAEPEASTGPPEQGPAAGASRRDGRRAGEQAALRGGEAPERRDAPPVDPLDDFFYRGDEAGPDLGALSSPLQAAPPPAEAVERVEYLTFRLGTEEYGVEIDRVREVMRSPPITEVPRAPVDVLGVITVRGEVVAVFDPRGRLGLPAMGPAEGGRVIIVDDGAGPCGLLVDAVASVVRLPRGAIEACPQGIGGASADCLQGIGRDRDRLFTVLSIPALLKPGRKVEGRGG